MDEDQQAHQPEAAQPPEAERPETGEMLDPRTDAYWLRDLAPSVADHADDDAAASNGSEPAAVSRDAPLRVSDAELDQDARDVQARWALEELAQVESEIDSLTARATRLRAGLGRLALAGAGKSSVAHDHAMRSMAAEVAARLRVTRQSEARAIDDAMAQQRWWADITDALDTGRINRRQAKALVEAGAVLQTDDVHDDQRASYLQQCLQHTDRVPTRLRSIARTVAETMTTDPLTTRHRQALADRHVRVTDVEDGMATLTALLPGYQAHAILDRLRTGADGKCADDPRTTAQWQADALAAVLLTGEATIDTDDHCHGAHCGDAACIEHLLRGITATVQVTIPIDAFGDVDLDAAHLDPSMLDGVAPMSHTAALALLGQVPGTITRVATDPLTGVPLATDARHSGAALHRWIQTRDGGACRGPACGSRSRDEDHTIDFAHGGPTSHDNLAGVCQSCHHGIKHDSRWTLRQPTPGVLEWTSPLGSTYTDTPMPIGVPKRPPTTVDPPPF